MLIAKELLRVIWPIIISWSRDLSITWSWHMTTHMIWSHDPNTWPTNFILISRHHWFQLLCYHLSRYQVIINSSICVTIPLPWLRLDLLHYWSMCLQPIVDLKQVLGGFTSRSTPIQDPVVVVWERSPQSLLIKTIGGSHDEWWVIRPAGRRISLTLKDINISFNHPPYYLISRGDSRVVTDKRVAW